MNEYLTVAEILYPTSDGIHSVIFCAPDAESIAYAHKRASITRATTALSVCVIACDFDPSKVQSIEQLLTKVRGYQDVVARSGGAT